MASSTCDENSKTKILPPASVSEDLETIYDHPIAKAATRCWKLFGFYKVEPGKPSSDTLDMSTAVCKICRKTYANKANTPNFLNHIDTMHPDHSAACRSDGKKDKQLVQPKLSFEKPKRSVERTKALDDAVMKFIVGKVLPVSLVDNEYLKQFVGLLDSKYKLPSRRDLVRGLEKKQDEMKAKISEDIKDSTSIAISHDGWTLLIL